MPGSASLGLEATSVGKGNLAIQVLVSETLSQKIGLYCAFRENIESCV